MLWIEYYQPCLPCQIGFILEYHFPLVSDLTVHMSTIYLLMLLGEQTLSLVQISLSKSVIGAILQRFSPVLNKGVVKYGGLYNTDFEPVLVYQCFYIGYLDDWLRMCMTFYIGYAYNCLRNALL